MERDKLIELGFNKEAEDLAKDLDYKVDETLKALETSYDYYIAIGEDEKSARDNAVCLVYQAAESAPRFDYDLASMVDYMLFSVQHRVPTCRNCIM